MSSGKRAKKPSSYRRQVAVGGQVGNVNNIVSQAMQAVSSAQVVVNQIPNQIGHMDSGLPYIPPDAPVIDPKTGKPKAGKQLQGATPLCDPEPQHPPKVYNNTLFNVKQGTLINVVNSQNVQIGHNNVMHINTTPRRHESDTDSSEENDLSDDGEPVQHRPNLDLDMIEIIKASSREVTNGELRRLAPDIGGGWRRLIRFLGIEDAEVDYIFHLRQSSGINEIIYQLLLRWKQNSAAATVGTLMLNLDRADMAHLHKHLRP